MIFLIKITATICALQDLTFFTVTDNLYSNADYQDKKFMDDVPKVEFVCPSDIFLKIIKGKCKTTLIVMIKKGRNRFGEMRKTLPTISERMLSRQLDELEKDGIITRKSFPEVPPRVEYYLTEYGETIYPVVREMRK